MTHVLVVDDEPAILRTLVMNLSQRGFDVTQGTTGADALEQTRTLSPDLLLLDLGLPDIDGLEVIRQVRVMQPNLAIVVVSARKTSHDKVRALDLGAVDYITKPFDMNELVARLRAAARRVATVGEPSLINLGDLRIDLTARRILRADAVAISAVANSGADGAAEPEVRLTKTEWAMLEILLRRPGSLVTSDELLIALRGDPAHTEGSYLRIYMAQLRRKLEAVPSRPRHLTTEPGVGYRFRP